MLQLASKEKEKKMSQQSQNSNIVSKWGSSFSETLSKSLELSKGVWTTTDRRASLQTTSSILTNPVTIPSSQTLNSSVSSNNSYGGTGSPTEKECRQVFFDCALWLLASRLLYSVGTNSDFGTNTNTNSIRFLKMKRIRIRIVFILKIKTNTNTNSAIRS